MTAIEKASLIKDELERRYPNTSTFLKFKTDWQLLFAVVLSAQATDKSVNLATEKLFSILPELSDYTEENRDIIKLCIKNVGLSNTKTEYLIQEARILLEEYGGVVPRDREKLQKLPGVGFKSSGVVLAEYYGDPYIPVDTHVYRVTHRLGIVKDSLDPKGTELQLEKIFNSTNFNDHGSRRYLFKYIEDSGVYDVLKEMGLDEGDTIKLFDMEFEYYEEDYSVFED